MIFQDRIEAANLLADKLEKYKNSNGIVLAIPRGGVPIGYVLSQRLNLPLDLILTKKIGHPAQPEYAIGSVSLQGMILGEQAKDIPRKYIEEETKRLRKAMLEKLDLYDGKRKHHDLKNKIVILVDDGIATGSTIMAALQIIRSLQPNKVVVAVPVSSESSARELVSMADEFICLLIPDEFLGVGQFYEDFTQVSDEKVIEFLQASEKSISQ